MGKAIVKVNPGICGFDCEITVESADGQFAVVSLKTECPSLADMDKELGKVDVYMACFGKMCDSAVYKAANRYCAHAACPIPSAILKGIEVTCGLALPKDVSFEIKKDE